MTFEINSNINFNNFFDFCSAERTVAVNFIGAVRAAVGVAAGDEANLVGGLFEANAANIFLIFVLHA
jgi:hypothetical protein